ncbi:MAG: fibronectin type III domain-containing protein [Kiritimatiellae bacterium]|nr:fibronectin type III domain-containing protein [Kiritimatiellia bacterium]
MVSRGSDKRHIFNGLTAETDYDFRVKTLYGSNKSKCAVLRFTTATQLPHEQGFENGMGRWETVYARWGYTGIDGTVKHDGASCFTFREYGSGQETQYLISPRFSVAAGIEVSFYHLANSENDASFYVGYSTTDSDPSSFTWSELITPTYLQWNRYERTFPAGTCYVAIQYNHVSSTSSHILCLDDFSVVAYSAYAKSTSVTVGNLTDTNATLSWTAPSGSPTGYTYQYKKVSATSWSAESNVSGTSVTLNSLTANTAYDFRVKARYSGGKASNYVSVRFMTEGPMVNLPFSEGFENGMGGWRIVDGLYGTGVIPNHAHTGSNDFMFTVNNATSPQYLISPCLNSGTIINVTFWYKANGNASFQVGYSTTTKATTAFTWGNATSSTSEWQLYTTVFPVGIKFVAVKWTGGLDSTLMTSVSASLSHPRH